MRFKTKIVPVGSEWTIHYRNGVWIPVRYKDHSPVLFASRQEAEQVARGITYEQIGNYRKSLPPTVVVVTPPVVEPVVVVTPPVVEPVVVGTPPVVEPVVVGIDELVVQSSNESDEVAKKAARAARKAAKKAAEAVETEASGDVVDIDVQE